MPRFAANLSMMFTEVPFLDRFDAAAKAGFTAVEFLFPYDHPADEVGKRLKVHHFRDVPIDLAVVVVYEQNQVIQLEFGGGHRGFPNLSLLGFAVAD